MYNTIGRDVAFGLPPGRDWASYYNNLHGYAMLLILVAAGIHIAAHYKLLKAPGLIKTIIGALIIILAWVFIGSQGLVDFKHVLYDTWHAVKAWLSG